MAASSSTPTAPHPDSNLGLTVDAVRAKLTDAAQRDALDQMYELAPPELRQDMAMMLRCLRATQWAPPAALKMYESAVRWRADAKPETLTPDRFAKKVESGFLEWMGFDKYGRAALYCAACNHFPDPAEFAATKEYIVWRVEQGIRLTESKGNEQFVIIYDRDNFSRKNFDLSLLKELAAVFSVCYAERLAKVYIVRPDWLFHTLFAIVKPFLDPVTVKKIVVLPKDHHKALLEDFADDQLVAQLGGTGHLIALNTPTDIAANLPPPYAPSGAAAAAESS